VYLHPEASEDNRSWSGEEIDNAIKHLTGEIQQVPPMYSAKKQGGKKLYELARLGQEVDREAVTVRIFAFERIGNQLPLRNEDGTADLNVRVECSAGTYIRVLAEDLGRLLGVGAHLAALRRTRVGDFHVRDAITLENLDRLAGGPVREVLKPPQLALSGMPFLHLSEAEAEKVRNGMALSVPMSSWRDGENIGLSDAEGKLVGVGQYDPAKHLVHPRVVLGAEKSC
jgi:tRNA pseudouridine55 synthase